MQMLDLFSGIGGFSLAAAWAGITTVGFCETDKFCNNVLKKHWPTVINYGDIRQLEFKKHVNLITGGFPCQPFSIAGKRKGEKDNRYLWHEFYRVIRESKPCWVVIENVTGLLSLGIENIIIDLENQNYRVESLVLPACAANAPHRRDRLWVIAHCPSQRCGNCSNHRQTRPIQKNQEWDMAQIQQEWSQLKPKSWAINKAGDWIKYNSRISRANDGLPNRVDRIKSVGNSIVPQIAYIILRFIKELEVNHGPL